jgi:hypothetical protein
VRFVAVLALVLLLVGCAQASSSVEKQQNREDLEPVGKEVPQKEQSPYIPAYEITKERECTDTGIVGKCYSVVTEVTSREDLEVITFDILLNNPEYLAIVVNFYPKKPTADVSGMGFAFKNEQVARVVLAQTLAQGSTVEDEVSEAMANGGITSSRKPMRCERSPRGLPGSVLGEGYRTGPGILRGVPAFSCAAPGEE